MLAPAAAYGADSLATFQEYPRAEARHVHNRPCPGGAVQVEQQLAVVDDREKHGTADAASVASRISRRSEGSEWETTWIADSSSSISARTTRA